MADEGKGFAARWSRLKRARREGDAADAPPSVPSAPAQAAAAEAAESPPPAVAEAPAAVADLPPIDSLDKDSDFTAFLKEGVPEALRNQALRKLWLSDPVLANLDGLLEYGGDLAAAWKTPGPVATLYRVGRGMVEKIEEIADLASPAGAGLAKAGAPAAAPAEAPADDEADDPAGPGAGGPG